MVALCVLHISSCPSRFVHTNSPRLQTMTWVYTPPQCAYCQYYPCEFLDGREMKWCCRGCSSSNGDRHSKYCMASGGSGVNWTRNKEGTDHKRPTHHQEWKQTGAPSEWWEKDKDQQEWRQQDADPTDTRTVYTPSRSRSNEQSSPNCTRQEATNDYYASRAGSSDDWRQPQRKQPESTTRKRKNQEVSPTVTRPRYRASRSRTHERSKSKSRRREKLPLSHRPQAKKMPRTHKRLRLASVCPRQKVGRRGISDNETQRDRQHRNASERDERDRPPRTRATNIEHRSNNFASVERSNEGQFLEMQKEERLVVTFGRHSSRKGAKLLKDNTSLNNESIAVHVDHMLSHKHARQAHAWPPRGGPNGLHEETQQRLLQDPRTPGVVRAITQSIGDNPVTVVICMFGKHRSVGCVELARKQMTGAASRDLNITVKHIELHGIDAASRQKLLEVALPHHPMR